jgi:hypothetical protein
MFLTGENFTHNQPFQSAFDGLNLINTAGFQTQLCEGRGNFVRIQRRIQVIFQPFVRYVHANYFLLLSRIFRSFERKSGRMFTERETFLEDSDDDNFLTRQI